MKNAAVLSAAIFVTLAAAPGASFAATGQEDSSSEQRIAGLIERLSDPRYAERVDAQRRLQDEGLRAFDALFAATESTDPEVAASCERLLNELTRNWAWLGDPQPARELLEHYGDYGPDERLETTRMLWRLPESAGLEGLVRIARFDPSPRVSREAARWLLDTQQQDRPSQPAPRVLEELESLSVKHGPSQRPAVAWLLLASASDSSSSSEWQSHVSTERRLLNQHSSDTSPEIVASLLWRQLGAGIDEADLKTASDAVDRLAELEEENAEQRLAKALGWLAEADLWEQVDLAIDTHEQRLDSKRGLYLQARLLARRGDAEGAELFAQRALQAEPSGYDPRAVALGTAIDSRIPLAAELRSEGHTDWAVREYAAVGDRLEPLTLSAVLARWAQSDLLHDANRNAEASEALAGLDQAINASKASQRAYNRLPSKTRLPLRSAEMVTARKWYYRALDRASQNDGEGQAEALLEAIEADPFDADILIAMHRVPEPADDFSDETQRRFRFSEETQRRIRELLQRFENKVNSNPEDEESLNGWAWLVSNTEGDYEKAIRYSLRSLELNPDTAGYLDTLGRCYYAAGRLNEALEAQRRAVELEPNVQTMRRQLDLFESEAEGSDTAL